MRGVCPAGCLSPEAVDTLLQRCEGGVHAALQYAKNMAKYMKDLIGYLEKRNALGASWGPRGGVWLEGPSPHPCAHAPPLTSPLRSHPSPPAEMDFAKGLQKIVQNCRQSVMQEVGNSRERGGAPQAWVCFASQRWARGKGFPISARAAEGAGEAAGLPRGRLSHPRDCRPRPHSRTCPSCPSTRWPWSRTWSSATAWYRRWALCRPRPSCR